MLITQKPSKKADTSQKVKGCRREKATTFLLYKSTRLFSLPHSRVQNLNRAAALSRILSPLQLSIIFQTCLNTLLTMGVAKILLLCGLMSMGCAQSYTLNFTEVGDYLFKIEVEVSENKTEVRCEKAALSIIPPPGLNNLIAAVLLTPPTIKPKEDKRCPGNLLDAIGKMKKISIEKGMQESKTGWWKDDSQSGAFVVDIYYSLMEISFEKGKKEY
jgi:hypothetical protein